METRMTKTRQILHFLAVRRGLFLFGVLSVLLFCFPIYAGTNLAYYESKGPFKNWMQVVDLEGDGDPDILISHTRWEATGISWAGIGRWINQGDGTFALAIEEGVDALGGHAGAAGDVDLDGDPDIFTQDFRIKLRVNQGGLQEGETGTFRTSGGIDSPPAFDQGYRDMGGTIIMADLNDDGLPDALITGCCYGLNAQEPGSDFPYSPAISWVWINEGSGQYTQSGHILPLDLLDGRPIRQAAIGDLDGDGDLDVFAAVGKPTLGRIDTIDDLVLLNDGNGNLSVYDQPFGNSDSTSIALGDVNGDGLPDALVGTDTGAMLWIHQGPDAERMFSRSTQSFAAERSFKGGFLRGVSSLASLLDVYLPYGSIRSRAVFLSDLDGDNDLDAVLARLWETEIWWNDGAGNFARGDTAFSHREDSGLAVADFDGDGDQDIFIGRNHQDYQAWWNDGKGHFSMEISRK